MPTEPHTMTLADWLTKQIENSPADAVWLWCDPDRAWLDLLLAGKAHWPAELWCPSSVDLSTDWSQPTYELVLRSRLLDQPAPGRCIIWLPRPPSDLTWLAVVAQQAVVWDRGIVDAVRDFAHEQGVAVPWDGHEDELARVVPIHAVQWLSNEASVWRGVTPQQMSESLIHDDQLAAVLGGSTTALAEIRHQGRFPMFVRRCQELGLPMPPSEAETDLETWRLQATATLLVSEAAEAIPADPPGEKALTIPPGLRRVAALRFLQRWRRDTQLMDAFETTVQAADAVAGLSYWARNLQRLPGPSSSRAVEQALFDRLVEELLRCGAVTDLLALFQKKSGDISARTTGFWARHARQKLPWNALAMLARAADIVASNWDDPERWVTFTDTVEWYTRRGWEVDYAGDLLYAEDTAPVALHPLRMRLQQAYEQFVRTRAGVASSDLLARDPQALVALPSAGEALAQVLGTSGGSTAIIYLDAFRFELGQRLAAAINHGEQQPRAQVTATAAPLPSITPLGMAWNLPISRDRLRVSINDASKLSVSATGYTGDLAVAADRRRWWKEMGGATEPITVAQALDNRTLQPLKRTQKKPLVIYGDELDTDGHDGQLSLTGTEDHLQRYEQLVRRLRQLGYQRVIITSDHGYLHWQGDADERTETPPVGEVLWSSRRAIIGRGLQHPAAIVLPIPGTDLQVCVPRSVHAFRTYGGLGFFHGGASLAEVIVPVVTCAWPSKNEKVTVVLKPVGMITSMKPRVAVEIGGQLALLGTAVMSRRVDVRIRRPGDGQIVFRNAAPVTMEQTTEGAIPVTLDLVPQDRSIPSGSTLTVELRDADDESILAREDVILKVDLDDW
jgi:hypothetical protein